MEGEIINFFYKWDEFERKNNNFIIIDFDLIQNRHTLKGSFQSREEVKKELLQIIKRYSKTPNKNNLVLFKLKATLYYLRALMGEKISFEEYVSNTIGFKPKYLPIKVFDEQLEKAKQAYAKLGYQYIKEDLDRYDNDNILTDGKEISSMFRNYQQKVLPKILNWLNLKINVEYKISYDTLNVYWMNSTYTDKKGNFNLMFNLKNNWHKWSKGAIEFLVLHEICSHIVQGLSLREEINKQRINPILGLITVATPEQFAMEGIAQSLHLFLPEIFYSSYGEIFMNENNLEMLVFNNVHIMANEGESIEKIIKFVRPYLPKMKNEEIKEEVKARTENPINRTYQYTYGIGHYYQKLIAKKLSKEKYKGYILDIYKNMYLPTELLKKYRVI